MEGQHQACSDSITERQSICAAICDDTAAAGLRVGAGLAVFSALMPLSLVRLNSSAFKATTSVLPDIDSTATSGLNTNGYKTPAARGNAIALYPAAHQIFWCIFRNVARDSSIAATMS